MGVQRQDDFIELIQTCRGRGRNLAATLVFFALSSRPASGASELLHEKSQRPQSIRFITDAGFPTPKAAPFLELDFGGLFSCLRFRGFQAPQSFLKVGECFTAVQ